jgi:outer membrane immunogenic protein
MKKLLVAGIAAAAVLCTAPALAADMPVKAPMTAAPVFNWTGCYVGGNVGGGWKHVKDNDAVITSVVLLDHTFDGWIGGGQIGCDTQLNNNWVVGVRGMWDASGVKGTKVGILNAPTDSIEVSASQFAALTAKAGYLINPTLQVYGEVGYGWVKEKTTYDCAVCGPPQRSSPVQDNRSGFDAGIGIDWMLQRNWDLFIEYDHIWLGKHQPVYVFPTAGTLAVNAKESFDKVLVGLNYRFSGDPWGKSPVVAKY